MELEIKRYKQEQERWRTQISLNTHFDLKEVKLLTGVDLAYWSEENKDYGVCSIVVINYLTKEVIEKVSVADRITVPYYPGYLAFRELPLILKAVECLKNQLDIYMFDGNGFFTL
ncbi:endonuclease V [uncultured Vagococcus sp.]|uniref:endonuclease V n=1 Tax=uncultured Vagococcus sp. TaxID=189676 RepID=UPI0028D27BC7|nr:endonuclease V [uncultured Vagococcus sp.]